MEHYGEVTPEVKNYLLWNTFEIEKGEKGMSG